MPTVSATTAALDDEWRTLATSPAGRAALERWRTEEPLLTDVVDLAGVMALRRHPDASRSVLAFLARLAPVDPLAARTLLQALLPGLIHVAVNTANDDPKAVEEFVSLAWERIRTYPEERRGSVAANVLWDVRKRYREHRELEAPHRGPSPTPDASTSAPSAEEVALEQLVVAESLQTLIRRGWLDRGDARLIVETRLLDVDETELAARAGIRRRRLMVRRWRAECRLRRQLEAHPDAA